MNNSNKLLNDTNLQNETTFPQVIFFFRRKDYLIAELLTIFSADLLDLIFLHNVIPPESPCAAIRVSVPTLNLLIIVIPTSTDYKIYYCNNCPTLGQNYRHNCVLWSKKSSFKLFNKKPHTQETEKHPYSVITITKSTDRPRPTENSPTTLPHNW